MPDNVIIISTVATSGSGNGTAILEEVYAFHAALAKKYSGLKPQVVPVTTPIPAQAAPHQCRVKVGTANVRQGPGINFQIIGQVTMGQVLSQVGKQDGWVWTDRGWINEALVEVL